jgi:hypothetical protein
VRCGDGIEVYFGYPHAHEDDPARVVTCALDMLQAVGQLANATQSGTEVTPMSWRHLLLVLILLAVIVWLLARVGV